MQYNDLRTGFRPTHCCCKLCLLQRCCVPTFLTCIRDGHSCCFCWNFKICLLIQSPFRLGMSSGIFGVFDFISPTLMRRRDVHTLTVKPIDIDGRKRVRIGIWTHTRTRTRTRTRRSSMSPHCNRTTDITTTIHNTTRYDTTDQHTPAHRVNTTTTGTDDTTHRTCIKSLQ